MAMQQQQPTQQPPQLDNDLRHYYELYTRMILLWRVANDPDAELDARRTAYERYNALLLPVWRAGDALPGFDRMLIEQRIHSDVARAYQLAKDEGRPVPDALQLSEDRI